jgi:hypothetical protein
MRRILRLLPVAIPLILLALLAWVVARGALAETPAEATATPTAQVLDDPELGRHVRAVVRVQNSLEEVWQVLTDHARYGDVCPYLRSPTFEPDPQRTTHLIGRIQGLANTFPLDVQLRQEQNLDEYRSTWSSSDADVPVNKGCWVVRRIGPRETVIEVAVAVEVRTIPTFLLRLLLRDRLTIVLANLQRRLGEVSSW